MMRRKESLTCTQNTFCGPKYLVVTRHYEYNIKKNVDHDLKEDELTCKEHDGTSMVEIKVLEIPSGTYLEGKCYNTTE